MSLSPEYLKQINRQVKKADRACRGIESALKISLDDELIEFGISVIDNVFEVTLVACLYIPSWDVEQHYTIGTYQECYYPEVGEIMEGAFILLSMFVLDHLISANTQTEILSSIGYEKKV